MTTDEKLAAILAAVQTDPGNRGLVLIPPDELDVLLPKLAGVPAREIAQTLGITEPVVDHRFRNALARIRKGLGTAQRGGKRGH